MFQNELLSSTRNDAWLSFSTLFSVTEVKITRLTSARAQLFRILLTLYLPFQFKYSIYSGLPLIAKLQFPAVNANASDGGKVYNLDRCCLFCLILVNTAVLQPQRRNN